MEPQVDVSPESAEPPADSESTPPAEAPLFASRPVGLPVGHIGVGETVYQDRTFTYGSVPEVYSGLTSLQTANGDKRTKGSDISFSVARDVQVFVAHDSRIKRKPDWLGSFRRTGQAVSVNEGGEEQKVTVYEVYVKDFPRGQVTLGPNIGPRSKKRVSMYLVFLRTR